MSDENWKLRTSVALLIFNRPDATRRVAAQIAKARPPKVLIFADGPRATHPGDEGLVEQTRAVIDEIEWPCDVLRNYSDVNLGTKYRPATGLDWVFETVEEAIFLEDDCLPDLSFFRFCDELLERYRHDPRVMMVSGDNFLPGGRTVSPSYFFSRYVAIWGWATWRRAWTYYDVDLQDWEGLRRTPFPRDLLGDEAVANLWRGYFDRIVSGETRTWDHQWQFACFRQQGLCVIPSTNLVSNVGFGPGAAHYVEFDPLLADVRARQMKFPLTHPSVVAPDRKYDEFVCRHLFRVKD
jgi:hypothetical protein